MSTPQIFGSHTAGRTLVLVPLGSVSSLAEEQAKPEVELLMQQLQQAELDNVVIDFQNVGYFGASMLETMRTLWTVVREHGGKMALCNISELGREILHVSRFDSLWPIYASRQEALEAVAK